MFTALKVAIDTSIKSYYYIRKSAALAQKMRKVVACKLYRSKTMNNTYIGVSKGIYNYYYAIVKFNNNAEPTESIGRYPISCTLEDGAELGALAVEDHNIFNNSVIEIDSNDLEVVTEVITEKERNRALKLAIKYSDNLLLYYHNKYNYFLKPLIEEDTMIRDIFIVCLIVLPTLLLLTLMLLIFCCGMIEHIYHLYF